MAVMVTFSGCTEIRKVDPLQFYLSNKGIEAHEVTVEILDAENVSIFSETYELDPEEKVHTEGIEVELGTYTYVLTLDGNVTRTYEAKADYAEDVSSSEILYIEVTDNLSNPFEISVAVA
ncbi:hypothetical protein [Methanosarcina sp. KYL-1]|uniref:hypothetical protein n=1 Tax=Methanosarcina sp. KYL-1 TaxID=2602068 RepID=UPI002101021E|nr:hypothetical protein [Methanosarcina sp. KYL-1]